MATKGKKAAKKTTAGKAKKSPVPKATPKKKPPSKAAPKKSPKTAKPKSAPASKKVSASKGAAKGASSKTAEPKKLAPASPAKSTKQAPSAKSTKQAPAPKKAPPVVAAPKAKPPAPVKAQSPDVAAAESLRAYLARLATYCYAQASEAGSLDEDPEPALSAWTYEAKWLFFTAYYLVSEQYRDGKAVAQVVEDAANEFIFELFEECELDPRALDDDYLAAARIFTGSVWANGPTEPARGIKKRVRNDGLDPSTGDDDEEEEDDDEDE